MRHTHTIETVIQGVGWLGRQEERALRQHLGSGGTLCLDAHTAQLHLVWNLDAETMDEAISTGHSMHQAIKTATGVYVPRTILFAIRETTEE